MFLLKRCLNLIPCSFVLLLAPFDGVANVTVTKLPTQLTTANITVKSYTNLEGHYIKIEDYTKLKIATPQLHQEPLRCDYIHPSTVNNSGYSKRTQCENEFRPRCDQLYINTPYNPSATDLNRMVPNQPVQYWVNKMKSANPSKHYVGFNLGFFNTLPLSGRSTNGNLWKPIYQESCGRALGTYVVANSNRKFYGSHSHREIFNGTQDKIFGTFVLKKQSSGNPFLMDRYTNLGTIADTTITSQDDFAVSGTWIKWLGSYRNKSHSSIPAFVQDKWDSKVGRTAVGINSTTKEMLVLVIQPGRTGNTGFDIEDVKNFFPAAYNSIMLLDGSGSSQIAATKSSEVLFPSSPGRTDCLWAHNIKTCSIRGDSVPKTFVSHWAAGYRTVTDPNNSSNNLVDRPVPQVMILEY